MSKGSISKKKKSDALKRHKENEKEEEEWPFIYLISQVNSKLLSNKSDSVSICELIRL
jgi:hypothetical protein